MHAHNVEVSVEGRRGITVAQICVRIGSHCLRTRPERTAQSSNTVGIMLCASALVAVLATAMVLGILPIGVANPVPEEFIISNISLTWHLGQLASRKERAIIFTTTRLPAHKQFTSKAEEAAADEIAASIGLPGLAKRAELELAMLSNFCWRV